MPQNSCRVDMNVRGSSFAFQYPRRESKPTDSGEVVAQNSVGHIRTGSPQAAGEINDQKRIAASCAFRLAFADIWGTYQSLSLIKGKGD
jgi:hypothetical protein